MNKELKKAKINIEIDLNENNIAEKISWLVSDNGQDYIDSQVNDTFNVGWRKKKKLYLLIFGQKK